MYFYKFYKSKEVLYYISNLWYVYLFLVYLEFKFVLVLFYFSIVLLYFVDRVMNNFFVWFFFFLR